MSVPSGSSDAPGSGGEVLAAFVEAELKAEDSRKTSIETREISVISTSGVLVTLLFALAAVITRQGGYSIPLVGLVAILASLVLFVAAASLGLLANAVKSYDRAKLADVENTVNSELETITERAARKLVSGSNLQVWKSARSKTNEKARLLRWAIIAEVAAVSALALSIAVILIDEIN